MEEVLFTVENLNTLNAAIAQGALRVRYSDKEVQYRSLSDMLALRRLMRTELGLIDPANTGRLYAKFNKGIQ